MPTVGIVRHQLFQPSETFIVNQALALRSFQPLFVGRDASPNSPRVNSLSVSEFGKQAVISYTLARKPGRLINRLLEKQTVLLHAHFGVEGVYAIEMARALGVPLVTTLHGFDVTVSKLQLVASKKPSWLNYVARRNTLFREGTVFICVSDHIRRRARDWGYPEDRIVVLPIGVDVERIQPVGFVDAPRILHVARLVEKKGTSDLLRAFAVVRKRIADAELVIVGDGPLRLTLIDLARELGVANSVRFLGARQHSDTLFQLRQSRLLCVPSVTASNGDQEGLPTVVLEAAAAGKPVVATNHGGIPEAVADGTNGLLVAERDVAGLADRLLTLLQDPELCQRFGEAGREMAVERFNLFRQTEKLESLYRTLI